MPKPKGWSEAMLKKRDRIEKAVERSGKTRSSAYAIATAATERMSGKKPRKRK